MKTEVPTTNNTNSNANIYVLSDYIKKQNNIASKRLPTGLSILQSERNMKSKIPNTSIKA